MARRVFISSIARSRSSRRGVAFVAAETPHLFQIAAPASGLKDDQKTILQKTILQEQTARRKPP
ncbi:MAG: hypothetical protein ABSG88_15190 [Bradyrhizobium sp.]